MAVTHSESVKYTFTPGEMVKIAKEQAQHMNELSSLEEQFENIKAAQKSKVTKIEAEVSDCTRKITSGYEMRMVKCLVLKFRPDKDHALVIRTDNGRVLRKRRLEDDEKQLKINTGEPEEFAFEADFFADTEGDLSELVADHVPMTQKEAEALNGTVEIHPLRKLIGDGK